MEGSTSFLEKNPPSKRTTPKKRSTTIDRRKKAVVEYLNSNNERRSEFFRNFRGSSREERGRMILDVCQDIQQDGLGDGSELTMEDFLDWSDFTDPVEFENLLLHIEQSIEAEIQAEEELSFDHPEPDEDYDPDGDLEAPTIICPICWINPLRLEKSSYDESLSCPHCGPVFNLKTGQSLQNVLDLLADILDRHRIFCDDFRRNNLVLVDINENSLDSAPGSLSLVSHGLGGGLQFIVGSGALQSTCIYCGFHAMIS